MAAWDELLDEADRKSFAKAKMGGTNGLGEKPAVVVVDMTYGFVDSRFRLGCSETGYPAVQATATLLGAARRLGIPVFYTRGFDDTDPAGKGMWKGGETKQPIENRIAEEIQPEAGEVVLQKRRPSAFFGTNLVDLLIYSHIDTLIVAGMSTSGCVRATVVDAFSYNYKVVVPEECVADRSSVSHRVSLLDMHMKYGDVLPLDVLINSLSTHG
jgi:maleamate amidohydrolase